jgi:hypothetical protein
MYIFSCADAVFIPISCEIRIVEIIFSVVYFTNKSCCKQLTLLQANWPQHGVCRFPDHANYTLPSLLTYLHNVIRRPYTNVLRDWRLSLSVLKCLSFWHGNPQHRTRESSVPLEIDKQFLSRWTS